MKKVLIVIALALTTALAFGAVAHASGFSPIYGQGEHTIYDEVEEEFGNTYEYYSVPTDDGWVTTVAAYGDYTWFAPTCWYDEEDETATLGIRFAMTSEMPFADEDVTVTITFDDDTEVDFAMKRQNEDYILAARVSGFTSTRAAEKVTIDVGPFSFDHGVKDMFDLPAAGNIEWCENPTTT